MFAPPSSFRGKLRFYVAGIAALLFLAAIVLIRSAAPAKSTAESQQDAARTGNASQSEERGISRSNSYAEKIITVTSKYWPEGASREGLRQYDDQIFQPTRQNEDAEIRELKTLNAELQKAAGTEQNKYVQQDLQIMLHSLDLRFKWHDFIEAHAISYQNPSEGVFSGLRALLDAQVLPERRQAALVRLRKYAGVESGYQPVAEIFKERTREQMSKPGMLYPSKIEIETALSRNQNFWDGIPALFKEYGMTGWEEPFARLKQSLGDYDMWVRTDLLPKARSDFRQPPEEYALSLQDAGIEIPAADLAKLGHEQFQAIQKEMQPIAAQIAMKRGWPDQDYRAVIARLKKEQLQSDAILPFYQQRLKQIEDVIAQHHLVTLPSRPARIRIASPAETTQQPAPHMVSPPLLNNSGEQGEFVLPLNMPAAAGSGKSEKVDDYTFDAASWTMIAHEARPGHELQFDSMVEHGISKARALFAFNSANVEGWGLYAEYITLPYMPPEGQLISLQFRLVRAARAFLDPELHQGKIKPADAMRVLTQDCALSVPFANQEVERYTFRLPGQAGSYLYGFTQLLALRQKTEQALGANFNQQRFHDFILDQGLLPPALLRSAIADDFIPVSRN